MSLIESYLIFNKLGKTERDRLGRLFNQIDTDHSGKIELKELENLITKIKPCSMNLPEAMTLAKNLDKDRSGTIDFNEFLIAMYDRSALFNEQQLSEVFEFLDKDNSGFLEKEELKRVLEGAESSEVEDLYEIIDLNHDSKISKKEFLSYLMTYNQ